MRALLFTVSDQNTSSLPKLFVGGNIVIEGLGLVIVEFWSKQIICIRTHLLFDWGLNSFLWKNKYN